MRYVSRRRAARRGGRARVGQPPPLRPVNSPSRARVREQQNVDKELSIVIDDGILALPRLELKRKRYLSADGTSGDVEEGDAHHCIELALETVRERDE